ncbi:MAG: site-2 protease family protein [Chloroflexi bacterium]|nr:site-2 protease family protein [Chloroflexota bacterium]
MIVILVSLFVLSVSLIVHELGHFIMAKLAGIKVEEFGIGYPPRLAGVRRGETVYSINLIPFGAFTRMLGEEDPSHPRSFARASKLWRTGVLMAGSGMHLLLAVLLFSAAFMAGWPTPMGTQVEVQKVLPDSPAAAAGMREGDIILAVAGHPVSNVAELRHWTRANIGNPVTIQVGRSGQDLALTVVPRAANGPLGIAIVERPLKIEPVSYGPLKALWLGSGRTFEVIVLTVYIPILIIRGLIPADWVRPIGIVGLYQLTSQAAVETITTGWWFPILGLSAVLNVGLAISNLLPIPGLDGGRLLFVAIEAIRSKRVSPEKEGLVHLIGMTVLIALMLIITYFDLLHPLPAIDWGAK